MVASMGDALRAFLTLGLGETLTNRIQFIPSIRGSSRQSLRVSDMSDLDGDPSCCEISHFREDLALTVVESVYIFRPLEPETACILGAPVLQFFFTKGTRYTNTRAITITKARTRVQ